MAGIGLLTTVGVIVGMDSFSLVTGAAQGIAEMSKRRRGRREQLLTNLDAVGNSTDAITEGIAIAVLAATAMFGSFRAANAFGLSAARPSIVVGVKRERSSCSCSPAAPAGGVPGSWVAASASVRRARTGGPGGGRAPPSGYLG